MKQALRTKMREKRKTLSRVLYAEKSEAVRTRLEQLPLFKEANRMLIYVSNGEEVDTHALIQNALKQGRKVFVPKIQEGGMVLCPLQDWTILKPGKFGILEPCLPLRWAKPQHMDLIIVPGVVFDPRGHRIGYGKGFYDKLLKETKGKKVGLAFHEQVIEAVPSEAHDVALDLIITDQTLIYP